jgi:hypothetical protein
VPPFGGYQNGIWLTRSRKRGSFLGQRLEPEGAEGGGETLKVARRVALAVAPVVALLIAGGANWKVA